MYLVLKISANPIKTSKAMSTLATYGAKDHGIIPESTSVNSKGSIGASFNQPETKNTVERRI